MQLLAPQRWQQHFDASCCLGGFGWVVSQCWLDVLVVTCSWARSGLYMRIAKYDFKNKVHSIGTRVGPAGCVLQAVDLL